MSRTGYTVFVGRLSRKTHPKDLEDVFGRYGEFKRCDIKLGAGMAYGFIEYEDRRDAEDAIRHENGRDLLGCNMVVEWARGEGPYRKGPTHERGGYGGGGGYSGGGGGAGYGGFGRKKESRSPSPRRPRRRSPAFERSHDRERKRSRSRDRGERRERKSRSRDRRERVSPERREERSYGKDNRRRSRSRSAEDYGRTARTGNRRGRHSGSPGRGLSPGRLS